MCCAATTAITSPATGHNSPTDRLCSKCARGGTDVLYIPLLSLRGAVLPSAIMSTLRVAPGRSKSIAKQRRNCATRCLAVLHVLQLHLKIAAAIAVDRMASVVPSRHCYCRRRLHSTRSQRIHRQPLQQMCKLMLIELTQNTTNPSPSYAARAPPSTALKSCPRSEWLQVNTPRCPESQQTHHRKTGCIAHLPAGLAQRCSHHH